MAERTCSIDGCEKPYLARGWCATHYSRWRKHGDPFHESDRMKTGGACLVDGCDKIARTRGLCPAHYQRQRTTGSVGAERPLRPRATGPVECSVEGCTNTRHAQGLCSPHVARLRLWGELRPEIPLGAYRRTSTCSIDGCEGPALPGSMCAQHLARVRIYGDAMPDKPLRLVGAVLNDDGLRLCSCCHEWRNPDGFTGRNGRTNFCADCLSSAAFRDNTIRRLRERTASAEGMPRIDHIDRRRVFEAADWTCGICGERIDAEVRWPDPMSASIDHIVPITKGGAHEYANLQPAHYGCNSRKSNRLAATA